MNKILITGCAGFIGFHLCNLFLNRKYKVVGIDNFTSSYPKFHKKNRMNILKKHPNFKFYNMSVSYIKNITQKDFNLIIHLAAEAGVRASLKNPIKFVNQNISNTIRIFEFAKDNNISKVFYASSSSIYGENNIYPSKEKDGFNKPLSIYGLTKSTNELTAYYYKTVFNISSIGFRFFTVYGPFGRPDMALFKFANNATKNKPINVFNKGNHIRDFTYVDDTINSILKVIFSNKKRKKFEIYNVSNNKAVPLMRYIREIEINLKKKIKKRLLNLQPGDIHKTHGSNLKFKKQFKYTPKVNVSRGVKNFINWFKNHH